MFNRYKNLSKFHWISKTYLTCHEELLILMFAGHVTFNFKTRLLTKLKKRLLNQ